MSDKPAGGWAVGRRAPWLAMLVVAAVVVPRSVAIARAHSGSCDDRYHLIRGLAFLARDLDAADIAPDTLVNDPPLGEGLVALPIWAANLAAGRRPDDPDIHSHPIGADALIGLVAAWKALLFLPMVGVAFAWCRSLYGARSACLSSGLLAIEPNLAAHIPIPALDVLGAESIVIAAFLAWRAFERPTPGRQAAAGIGLASSMAIKHTALVVPPILAALSVLWWGLAPRIGRPRPEGDPGRLVDRLGAVARTLSVAGVALWALLLFDVSPKSFKDAWAEAHPAQGSAAGPRAEVARWPCGSYIRSVKEGLKHNGLGHPAYLLGEKRELGWWYYFPVVAAIKVPVGVGLLLGLAAASLGRSRPRWAEWGPALPALACMAVAVTTKINIGFRHFLPAYAFLLLLSTRSLVAAPRFAAVAAWASLAGVAVHSAGFHPDYLSYTNGLWSKPHLAISDSNVDWGQGVKEVRDWVDARPRDRRPIRLGYFGDLAMVRPILGERPVEVRVEGDPLPADGLLIVSPVFVAGPYDPEGNYEALRGVEPVDVIGHCLLVFDIDRLRREGRLPGPARPGAD